MRYSNQVDGCQIWKGYEGRGYTNSDTDEILVEYSPRTDVKYAITLEARWRIGDFGLDDSHKARLTTMLINQQEQGDHWPKVTTTLIEEAKNAPPLSVHERADRLLRYLSNLTSVVGDSVSLGTPAAKPDPFGSISVSEGPTFWGALAWSESLQVGEIRFLMDYLRGNGWIKWQGDALSYFTVTVDGYSHVADQAKNAAADTLRNETANTYDFFIAHASEDKDDIVRILAERLRSKGAKVWYDEFTLKIGSRLRREIDRGLVNSRFGIVVVSHNFFAKDWPQIELDGLLALDTPHQRRILPIWYKVTKDEVARYSPILAGIVALNMETHTIEEIAEKLLSIIQEPA